MKPSVLIGRQRFRALGTVVLAAQLAACGNRMVAPKGA